MARCCRFHWGLIAWLLLPGFLAPSSMGQQPEVVFRSAANLVLVDVMASKNGLPMKTLRREDFQLFDNGRAVPIKTFDTGAQSTTRPLAVWFVVQCQMPGWEAQGSGLFAGEMSRFSSALQQIDKRDAVGLAHWCDNGDAQVDLQPTRSVDEEIAAVERVLADKPNPKNHNRPGEVALQKTLQLIVDGTRSAKPEPLPVVIFLYGDWSGMPKSEANHFVDELLETSAVAFGIADKRSPRMWFLPGEQKEVAHYIAAETGGQYLQATPDNYGKALTQILDQLHFRYELGFEPAEFDGKRHKLTVKLAAHGAEYTTVRLHHRAAYVPVAPSR